RHPRTTSPSARQAGRRVDTIGYVAFWRGFTRPSRYAALLAGAVPVLAFPSLDLEFLAWIGLVPGLLLLRLAPSAPDAAFRGWCVGAGYMSAAVYWLIPNLGPGLLLVVIVLGVPWAGVGLAAWCLLRGPHAASQQTVANAPSSAPARSGQETSQPPWPS